MKIINIILAITLLLNLSCSDRSNNINEEFKTLFHENGQLIEKVVDPSLIFMKGLIKNEFINSLTIYQLDSIIFESDNPDKTIIRVFRDSGYDVDLINFGNKQYSE